MFMGIALLLAVYSSFLPFVANYGNTMQYTAAYYGALSALERGVLAASYAGPGFDGESGRKIWTHRGNDSDQNPNNFYTYGNPKQSSLYWTVKSSTTQIPTTWNGNVEADFWGSNDSTSKNYNAMEYNRSEIIPLGVIEKIEPQSYYTGAQRNYTLQSPKEIKVSLRFNPYLTENAFAGTNHEKDKRKPASSIEKTPLVNWTLKGYTNGKNEVKDNEPFSIIPYESRTLREIHKSDTLIRGEKLKDGSTTLSFGDNTGVFGEKSVINTISAEEEKLKENYKSIFAKTKNTNLTLDLTNLLKSQGNMVYPFLEYQILSTNSNAKISDRFFTVHGEGKVGNYNIRLQIKKPVLDQAALGNFTIIF